MSLLFFYWCDVNYGGSRRNLCDVILAFVYKQMVTSYYSVELLPFPAKLWESPSPMGHALVSSGDFPLHCDSRELFRISGWSASSSLYFTWYLLNAESIYGHFPNDVPCSLPKNRAPPFFLLHYGLNYNNKRQISIIVFQVVTLLWANSIDFHIADFDTCSTCVWKQLS